MPGPFADASLDASYDASFAMVNPARMRPPRVDVVRARIAERLRLLRAAAPDERGALLLELRDWITQLIVTFEDELTVYELRALRELAAELVKPVLATDVADVWDRAIEVLEAFALDNARAPGRARPAFWRRNV